MFSLKKKVVILHNSSLFSPFQNPTIYHQRRFGFFLLKVHLRQIIINWNNDIFCIRHRCGCRCDPIIDIQNRNKRNWFWLRSGTNYNTRISLFLAVISLKTTETSAFAIYFVAFTIFGAVIASADEPFAVCSGISSYAYALS